MRLNLRRLGKYLVLAVIPMLIIVFPKVAGAEKVLFEDSFQRTDSASPGPQWQEYVVRRTVQTQANVIPKSGETPWSIRGNSLYFEATGENKYIEDFIQTNFELPVDNTRVEFEVRATGGTRLGYVGPVFLWAGTAEERRDSHNTAPNGRFILGVQAWYQWEKAGKSGVYIHGTSGTASYPNMYFSGFNQGKFAKHVITIQGGKITYESPDCQKMTLDLRTPLAPGETRRFSIGARLYDRGIKETIEVRNLKITSLEKPKDKLLGDAVVNKLNEEFAKLAVQLKDKVRSGMTPMSEQSLAKSQALMDKLDPQIEELLKPVIAQALSEMQTQAQAQMENAKSMMSSMPQGIPSGINIPSGTSIPKGIPVQGAPNTSQITNQVLEQVTAQVKSQMLAQSQAQTKLITPQIEALIQSIVVPAMPEFESIAQDQAQVMALQLDTFLESRFTEISGSVKSMLPPDVQKLSNAEIEAMLYKELEKELKPQITALIEEEVQAIVKEKVITPIKNQITTRIRSQVNSVNSQIMADAEGIFNNVNSSLPIGPAIKQIMADSFGAVEEYVVAETDKMFSFVAPSKFLITVLVNGQQVSYDALPMIKEGRTLVPLRAIAQSLGAQVQWDAQSQTISITSSEKVIKLVVNQNSASINEMQVDLDVPATIVNGRTFVPARFISESMGAKVSWDQQTKTASITR